MRSCVDSVGTLLQMSVKSGFVSVATEITTLLAQMDSSEYVICIAEEIRATSVC